MNELTTEQIRKIEAAGLSVADCTIYTYDSGATSVDIAITSDVTISIYDELRLVIFRQGGQDTPGYVMLGTVADYTVCLYKKAKQIKDAILEGTN